MNYPIDLLEQNRQQAEQIRLLLQRVDKLMNEVALLKEENQRLKDEIAYSKVRNLVQKSHQVL